MRNVIARADVYAALRRFAGLAVALMLAVSCGGDATAPSVASLRFVSQPANIVPGKPFSVTVELLDAKSVRIKSATAQVTIAAAAATVSGPATVSAVAGLATFDGLTVSGATSAVQFTASSAGLAVSSPLLPLKSDPVSLSQSAVSPAPCSIFSLQDVPLAFSFKDAFGNPVVSAPVTLSTGLAGTTLTPASGTTSGTGGFATTLKTAGLGSAAITATVDGTAISFPPFTAVPDPVEPTPIVISRPATVTGTLSNDFCVTSTPRVASYQLAVTAGATAFAITSAFNPLYVMSEVGSSALAVLFAFDSHQITQEYLHPAGTFLFRMRSLSTTGTYTLQATSVPANTGPAERVLLKAGTYTGQSLAQGDQAFDDGSLFDFFYFAAAEACTLTLKSTAFNPFFAVIDALTGDLLGLVPGSGIGVDAVIQLPGCAVGTHPIGIYANSLNSGETGAYTLVITLAGGAGVRATTTELQRMPTNNPVLRRAQLRGLRAKIGR